MARSKDASKVEVLSSDLIIYAAGYQGLPLRRECREREHIPKSGSLAPRVEGILQGELPMAYRFQFVTVVFTITIQLVVIDNPFINITQ